MVNPIAGMTDLQLYEAQLALALACGKSHSSLKKRHRQYFCQLFEALKIEADQRGTQTPQWPYRA